MIDAEALIAELPRLRRYGRALLGDVARADDLVQDTIERALRKAAHWQGGNLRAWLLTLMHNVFVNQVRRNDALRGASEADAVELAMRDASSDGLGLRDLDRAMQTLSADHREILLLVGLENLRYEEIAGVLDVPIGTVMSRLSRARTQLKAQLDGSPARPALTRVK
ncbi:RNA polymerase sigma factor [Denitromonas ohlonensis]|jgi:RNA polymerase sigma-70 factor (ECF subfamily)|uniref:RNA polymerase sigma factor n=2 Tax=Denitromonas TaxID=139331 RepID=A0A557S8F1_9RHOO|nr:RNA polymerase sigma factor [Denitromonas ohlonensis]TVO63036.1 RNA polymerase sigma factor [Denitromonas ohlonensis]TVO73712.1 RNA polymerase sigma factor [Denitromonas ohlonensis]TVT48191.1 MAG: RNA polymerase sigma factor [Denitromonas halophila]TVT65628.1 MAG: RNA polymerase sigma factor [Denitromonas halophila]